VAIILAWAIRVFLTTDRDRLLDNGAIAFAIVAVPTAVLAILCWIVNKTLDTPDAIRGLRSDRRMAQGLCGHCGYSLAGNVSGTCPECGTSIPKIPTTPKSGNKPFEKA